MEQLGQASIKDATQGILGGLKGLSPNVTGFAEGNVIKIKIPKDDIIANIFKGTDPKIASSMKVELTPEGFEIEVKLF